MARNALTATFVIGLTTVLVWAQAKEAAPSPAPAARCSYKPLPGLTKIRQDISGVGIEDTRPQG